MSFRKHEVRLETMIRPMRKTQKTNNVLLLVCDLDFKPVMKTVGRVQQVGYKREKEV